MSITEIPTHARKSKEYGSKLDKYKKEIIEMNNKGYSWKIIRDTIKKKGYVGSDSLIRHYLAKIKKEVITTGEIEQIVERTTMISLLYRDIEKVKNGIKYEYNNRLAEGSVNKIKVIKRIMYGRCSFELLKQKVLLQS